MMNSAFTRLLMSHGANALSIGIQLVLVVWLAAVELHATAFQLALVQAALLVPNIVVLPFAGVWVDRVSPARLMIFSNLGLCLFHGVLAGVLWYDQLSFYALLAYGALIGACNGVIQSGREKLISDFPVGKLHRRISLAGISTQAAQVVGIAIAGLAQWASWESLVGLQSLLCLLAALLYARLPHVSNTVVSKEAFLVSLSAGVKLVWSNVPIRHVVFIVAFNGFMQMGMLGVLLPVIAHTKMAFDTLQYSLLQLGFALGALIVQWVLLKRRGSVRQPGQAVLFCLMYSAAIALAISYGPTPLGLYALIFLWGCVSGASANLGRLVVKAVAPKSHTGRSMSVYQFALFGSAPFGALFAGWMLSHYPMEKALLTIAYGCFTVFFASFFTRALWSVQINDEAHLGSHQNGTKGQ